MVSAHTRIESANDQERMRVTSATCHPGAFTFVLPAGWAGVPVAGSHDVLLATLRSRNAAFAKSLAGRLENRLDTTPYVVFDDSPAAVTKGDLATLVVTEVALPIDASLQWFARISRGGCSLTPRPNMAAWLNRLQKPMSVGRARPRPSTT